MLNRRIKGLLRKGIAVFLLLILVGSSMAFAGGASKNYAATGNSGATAPSSENVSDAAETGGGNAASDAAGTSAAGNAGVNTVNNTDDEADKGLNTDEFANVGTVKVTSESEETEGLIEEMKEEGEVMIFSQTTPTNKTVKLFHTKAIKYESYKTHNFTATVDGKNVVVYCIEPAVNWGGKGNYTATPYNAALMTKALYYSYANPGYSPTTANYLAGVSKKACYKGNDGVYALCHIMLSYIYDGESGKGDAFKGCSDATKKVVRNFVAKIKTWPDPPGRSQIGLSATSVRANWNYEKGYQETEPIKVGGTNGNSIEVSVPEGASLNAGGQTLDSGSLRVGIDESFSFSAPATVRGEYNSPNMPAAITDFQPYLIKPKGKQDELFSLNTVNYISFKVEWENFGRLELIKISADPAITAGVDYFSLEGAEYGLYHKAAVDADEEKDDVLYGKLVTDSTGKASLDNVPYGDYYIKELTASPGYKIDTEIHDITVASSLQSETLLEQPSVPDITTYAAEKDSNNKTVEEGGIINISDTVTYSGILPGKEYTITGRLMNKATETEVPGTENKVDFKAEESEGSLKMDYSIDSSQMGDNTVVAFEKLYYNDSLIATHEDINNKDQSVTIKAKPAPAVIPEKDKNPATGDKAMLSFCLGVLILSLTGGMIALVYRRKF